MVETWCIMTKEKKNLENIEEDFSKICELEEERERLNRLAEKMLKNHESLTSLVKETQNIETMIDEQMLQSMKQEACQQEEQE